MHDHLITTTYGPLLPKKCFPDSPLFRTNDSGKTGQQIKLRARKKLNRGQNNSFFSNQNQENQRTKNDQEDTPGNQQV